ncbi:MAG: hypothetical protein ACHQQ3_08590 [Gemmatimonadales bacterium]
MTQSDIDQILDKLAKDVEAAVHALYRGEVRQATAKARTGHLVQEARGALSATMGTISMVPRRTPDTGQKAVSPRPSVFAPALAGAEHGWSKEDSDAVLRCIMAWLPMGGPATTAPDTKCIAAGKMLLPTWGERVRALDAVRRITPG